MDIFAERKAELIKENEWLPKAIEMLNMRLIDRGFNVLDDWLGYYDEYVLHYVPQTYINNRGEKEVLNWGKLEIHCKEKVFNPYKYCGGNGYEFEKLTEMSMKEKHWKIIKQYIRLDDYQVCGKKVCFDNPYPRPRVEFIDGSDVPVNGYYE